MWDVLDLWAQLKGRVRSLITEQTADCLRVRRYDVVADAADGRVRVCLPCGSTVLELPCTAQTAQAKAGETVLVLSGGGLRVAFCMGSGPK